MLQATPIIPHEVQIGEAQRHTNSLLQDFKGMNVKLKMQTHKLSLDKGVRNPNLDRED